MKFKEGRKYEIVYNYGQNQVANFNKNILVHKIDIDYIKGGWTND